MEKIKTDVVVVGTGAAGLYHALHLPKELQICMITKDEVDRSDSFLAQGGMCMPRTITGSTKTWYIAKLHQPINYLIQTSCITHIKLR